MTNRLPLPTAAVIDPVNRCNLRCHLCPTGQKNLKYPQSYMSFENFRQIICRFPVLKTIDLYNWGEPFLNPSIFDMISYAKEKRIFTQIHTNLSFNRDDAFFKSLALNSPHKLIISLDGASMESYSNFRVHGKFDLVIDNINKIKRMQKEYGTSSFIQWKYIVNAFNEHEILQARRMAGEMGIRIQFVPMSIGDEMVDLQHQDSLDARKKKWLPSDSAFLLPQYSNPASKPFKGICTYLFKTIVINPDGGVFPCCYITDEKNLFGNLLREELETIWYNDKYEHSRSLFVKDCKADNACSTICDVCPNFEKISEQ